jgi:hypothetical protein
LISWLALNRSLPGPERTDGPIDMLADISTPNVH